MALSDYRLCDVCDGKAFYDANLNYEFRRHDEPIEDGVHEISPGLSLDYLGDWAVLCVGCAKTHQIQIVVKVEGGRDGD